MDLAEIKRAVKDAPYGPIDWLIAEVERLTQLNTAVMAERHEMHDRLLSRAGEAEGRVLRLTEEMERLKDSGDKSLAEDLGIIWNLTDERDALQAEVKRLTAALAMDKTAQQALLVGDEIAQLQSSLTRSKAEGRREGMEDLVCYMIDNCERETITEEYLQGVLADCIRFFDIAAAIRQQAVQGTEGNPAVCGWKPWDDESGCYDTGCGNVQYFSEGNVADNRYKVCPYCGKNILVKV